MHELNRRNMLGLLKDILMAEKPTYNELERKIKKLKKEALEYISSEREFKQEHRSVDFRHLNRKIS